MRNIPLNRVNDTQARFDPEPPLAVVPIEDECYPVFDTDFTNRLLLWQLADSAFPIGGFAHSGGLEAARQHGELRNRNELKSFIESTLSQAARLSLPIISTTHAQPERLPELDRLCEAFTTSHVANRASRLQGQALLATAERIFASRTLKELRHGSLPPPFGHFAPTLGAVTSALGIDAEAARQLFMFVQLRGLISSAIRLNIAGPLDASALQYELRNVVAGILDQSRTLSLEQIAQTSPLLEVWQSSHDRLYSRLFQS